MEHCNLPNKVKILFKTKQLIQIKLKYRINIELDPQIVIVVLGSKWCREHGAHSDRKLLYFYTTGCVLKRTHTYTHCTYTHILTQCINVHVDTFVRVCVSVKMITGGNSATSTNYTPASCIHKQCNLCPIDLSNSFNRSTLWPMFFFFFFVSRLALLSVAREPSKESLPSPFVLPASL